MFEQLFTWRNSEIQDQYDIENRLRISVFQLAAVLVDAANVLPGSEKVVMKQAYRSRSIRALKYSGWFGPTNCSERARPIFTAY